jgi:hypothetical protein
LPRWRARVRVRGGFLRCSPPAWLPPRARRPRRAVNYDDSEPDADEDEDLELAPPDDEDGWD